LGDFKCSGVLKKARVVVVISHCRY